MNGREKGSWLCCLCQGCSLKARTMFSTYEISTQHGTLSRHLVFIDAAVFKGLMELSRYFRSWKTFCWEGDQGMGETRLSERSEAARNCACQGWWLDPRPLGCSHLLSQHTKQGLALWLLHLIASCSASWWRAVCLFIGWGCLPPWSGMWFGSRALVEIADSSFMFLVFTFGTLQGHPL